MVNLVNQPLVDQLLKQVPSSAIEAASAQLDTVERVADDDLTILTMDDHEKRFLAALLVARADIDGPGSTAARLCDRLVGKEST